jgi:quercetin dioxygenase-like cupin family protein
MTVEATPHRLFVYRGIRVYEFFANKGEGAPKHEHQFSHSTMCIAGSIVVRKEDKEITLTPDNGPVLLPAKEWHEIEALEDNTIFMNME